MKAHNLSHDLSWVGYDDCISSNLTYWQSASSKKTSMSLGTQKGFVANPANGPNTTELPCIST